MYTPINMDKEEGALKKKEFTQNVLENDLFPHCPTEKQKIYSTTFGIRLPQTTCKNYLSIKCKSVLKLTNVTDKNFRTIFRYSTIHFFYHVSSKTCSAIWSLSWPGLVLVLIVLTFSFSAPASGALVTERSFFMVKCTKKTSWTRWAEPCGIYETSTRSPEIGQTGHSDA